jgi:hypothetical protein
MNNLLPSNNNTTLSKKDYQHILQFYQMEIPKSQRLLQLKAENILSEKLCRCIKKLDPINESRSVGICTKTIINSKGITRGKFSCKKKQKIVLSKKGKTIKTIKSGKRGNMKSIRKRK